MYPNKRLGQCFLINKEKVKKIIDAVNIRNNDTVIEIGAGKGELTRELAKYPGVIVIAIEKDQELIQILKKKFISDKNTEIILGDALKLLPELTKSHKLKSKTYKVVGNIPYYITGQLLRVISELAFKPDLVVLTLQKEVAERLCAKPPKMNLLAASVQFWAEPEIIDYIPKKDFKPKPKVDSAIVRLRTTRMNADSNADEHRKYYELIRILFKQPRKTILNNLGIVQKKEEVIKKLQKIGVDPNGRPQDLSIEIIEKLNLML